MEEYDKSISLMLATLEGSPLLAKMETEWETLAKELDVPPVLMENIRSDVVFYSANSQKVLTEILLNWRLRCGSHANFTTLVKVMEERCHWINIGAQLQRNIESCMVSEISQETEWKTLPPCKQGELCTKEVFISGVKRSLMSFTKGITGNGLRNILNATLNTKELYNFVNTTNYELILSTVPDPLPYYVKRKLFLKNKICLNSISSIDTDIFVFEGIDKKTLDILSGFHSDLSNSQINSITFRFILLEQPDHFDLLCQKTTSTIHYIRFKLGNYFWLKTFGNLKNSFKFTENYVCTNEDSFIKIHLSKHSPCVICISGRSGEGKTTFLANIARKVQNSHNDRIVIFIHFRDILTKVYHDEIICQKKIVRIIAEYVSSNELGRAIISNIFTNKNYQLELFLDGYDELFSPERKMAETVLQNIAKDFVNLRVFITANEHQHKELEQNLGSITWGMEDFEHKNQVKLLSLYWSHFQKIKTTESLNDFAEKCVNLLVCTQNNHTIQFVGNPILTVILAQQFENLVRDFLAGTIKTLDSRRYYVTRSLLYETFFQGKFEKLGLETKPNIIKFALKRVFPEMVSNNFSNNIFANYNLADELQIFGLLHKTSINSHLEFVHKSFAEYISIQHLIDEIHEVDVKSGAQQGVKMLSYLLETSITFNNQMSFVNLTLCLVFEAFLLDQSQLDSLNAGLIFEQICIQKLNLRNILLACVNNELYAMFCLLLRGVPTNSLSKSKELPDMSAIGYLPLFKILDMASHHVSIKLVKKLLQSLGISHAGICNLQLNRLEPLGIIMTPLHFAAKQGNTKLFNYVFKSINISCGQVIPMFLCHAIVHNSKYDFPDVVTSKLEIITKLVRITYGQILHEKSDQISLVQFLPNIHIAILKCLIENGIDLFAVDTQQNTFLHQVSEYVSADEYHNLVEILLHKNAGSIFRKNNRKNGTAFAKALRMLRLEERTLHLLLTSKEINMEGECSPQDTHVYQVIKAGYGSDVLATALEHTSDWNQGSFVRGCVTLLHVAVRYQNIEAVKYMIDSVGVSINARDESGMTPYHVACSSEFNNSNDKSLEILQFLLEHGANVRLTDKNGKTPLSYLISNTSM